MKNQEQRPEVSFKQLCAIALRELQATPTIDEETWQDRILDRAMRDGYQAPTNSRARQAIEAITRAHPRLRQRPNPSPTTRLRPDPTLDQAAARRVIERLFRSRGMPMPTFLQKPSSASARSRPNSNRTITITSPGWVLVDGVVQRETE